MSETQQAIEGALVRERGRRHEVVGMVTSAKTINTVVVVVDRLVRHPRYHRVLRRRSKFMAHDELGCHVGDKVRLIETRPLSARKRWRVVEVIQSAARPADVGVVATGTVDVTA
jgi:small subunit ribosomal protein S17